MGENIQYSDSYVLFIRAFITGMDLSETIIDDELISLTLAVHGIQYS